MKKKRQLSPPKSRRALLIVLGLLVVSAAAYAGIPHLIPTVYVRGDTEREDEGIFHKKPPKLDTAVYDRKMLALAHINVASTTRTFSTTTPADMVFVKNANASTSIGVPGQLWPAAAAYPKYGALLPDNRIVAYYGNFYSKGMGVLGEYPEEEMLAKLAAEKAVWEAADPTTPVMPAINYIAITAQGSAGKEGLYMLRMPDNQIDYALTLAEKIGGIVILDIQIGFSSLQKELPLLEPYLSLPNVHLGLDPEFHMVGNDPPGDVIGTYDAADINFAAGYLANLVRTHDLPPKVLIVHRFTEDMVTNANDIEPLPEVQVVMDMDGWGFGAKKINTYKQVIIPEPVQFTGFKLFYKNDLKPPSTRLLTPAEVLELTPAPSFIQYQ